MSETSPAPSIRFRALGPVDISGASGVDRLLAQPKLVVLLTYLAIGASRGYVARERVIGAFWPDHPPDRARSSLRSALYTLRDVLGAEVFGGRGDFLSVDSGRIACDATEFLDAVREGHLARALELYRGPLLEGMYPDTVAVQDWLDEERKRFRSAAADTAWMLAERYESSASDLTSAARWARRAASLAGADERRIRRVMSLLDRAGDTAGAIGVFEEFARWLWRELELEPSEETRGLARSLRERGSGSS